MGKHSYVEIKILLTLDGDVSMTGVGGSRGDSQSTDGHLASLCGLSLGLSPLL